MNWIIENWCVIVGLLVLVTLYAFGIYKFINMPYEQQIKKVKEWMLWAVIQAERELGVKTGQIKLRYVYDLFVSKFPSLVNIITFEKFSELVDEALEQMKHLMETNNNIRLYIKEV